MNISSINPVSNIAYNRNLISKKSAPKSPASFATDVFQRSNVSNISFKGNDSIIKNDFLMYVYEIAKNVAFDMIQELNTQANGFDTREILEFAYQKVLQEQLLYVCISATGEFASKIAKMDEPIEEYIGTVFGQYTSFILEALEQAGVRDNKQYARMLQTFDLSNNEKLSENFSTNSSTCLSAYSKLKQKSHISRYPDLMIDIYLSKSLSDDEDYSKMDEIGDHLFSIGCFSTEEFVSRHPELKARFGDMVFSADIVEAIEYHKSTLPIKKEFLKEILAQHPEIKYNQDTLYRELSEIVDNLYEKNNGKNLGNLSSFISVALNASQFKPKNLELVAPRFNNFESIQDRIDFYTLIATTNTTPKELDAYCAHSFVQGVGPIEIIENKNDVAKRIAFVRNISFDKALDIYKNNSSVLSLFNDDSAESYETLNSILSLIDSGSFRKNDSLLNYYNICNKTKEKTLTRDQIYAFVELLKYSNGQNMVIQGRKEGILPVDILKRNKEQFASVKNQIENFLQNTNAEFYMGMSAFDVYRKYSTLILSNKENIPSLLAGLANVDGNIDEYNSRKDKIESLKTYFEDISDLREFLELNQIKLLNNEADEKYFESCLKVLNLIYDENSPEESLKRIKKLSNLQLLKNSKAEISAFIQKYESKTDIKNLFNLAIDKSVSKLSLLDDTFENYKDVNGDYENIIAHLSNIPDNFTFNDYVTSLDYFSRQLNNYSQGLNVDNSNILNLDVEALLRPEKFSKKVNQLICMLMGRPEANNYIGLLDHAKINYSRVCTKFAIANEIANLAGKTDESYKNIVRELGLDKSSLGLMDKSNFSDYINAINAKLPDDFVRFVASDEWTMSNDNQKYNLNCHDRLRIIDRFILRENGSINNLYSKDTIERLKKLLNVIYNEQPIEVEISADRLKAYSKFEDNIIVSIFSKSGTLITVYPEGM